MADPKLIGGATQRFIGLSTDTKPTGVPVGSTIYDRDAHTWYVCYDGTNWGLKSLLVDEGPVACAAGDVHEPAANTAAVVTYTAAAAVKHVITGVAWSYVGGIPTGGNLKVEDVSGTTVFSIDIDESGPGSHEFPKPKKSAAANTAMIITLAAGGAGVTGKLNITNHWTEA